VLGILGSQHLLHFNQTAANADDVRSKGRRQVFLPYIDL
jgi:hypothetical protein